MKSKLKSIAKVVIFAVDIEELNIQNSLQNKVLQILSDCQTLNIPYYFSGT